MKLMEKVCCGEFSCVTVAARVFSGVLGPQAASLESERVATASEITALRRPR